jgi:Kef-type K+ transport system membrane component KefB
MHQIFQALLEVLQPWLEAMPPILLLGFALLAGAAAGEGFARLKLPRVLGYWLTGVGCYAVLAQLMSDEVGYSLTPHLVVREGRGLFELALGFVLVELGRRIRLQWLINNRALFATSLLESAVTFGAVTGLLLWWGYGLWTCMLLAAVCVSTSPIVIAAVVAQGRAEGQISERALHLSAVNTIIAAVLASGLLTVANSARDQLDWAGWLRPVSGLVLAALVGTVGGHVMRVLLRAGARWAAADGVPGAAGSGGASSVEHAWAYGWQVFIGVVLAAMGVAQWLEAPVLVTALVLGITATQGSQLLRVKLWTETGQKHSVAARGVPWPDTAPLVPFLSAGLFVFAAAALPWSEWWALLQGTQPAGSFTKLASLTVAIVLVRAAAKIFGVSIAAPWANARRSQSLGLALAMQPMAITGLALLLQVQLGYAPLQQQALQALWLALAITDVLAPIILFVVLRASGEATPATKPILASVNGKKSGDSGFLNTQIPAPDSLSSQPPVSPMPAAQLPQGTPNTSFSAAQSTPR